MGGLWDSVMISSTAKQLCVIWKTLKGVERSVGKFRLTEISNKDNPN